MEFCIKIPRDQFKFSAKIKYLNILLCVENGLGLIKLTVPGR